MDPEVPRLANIARNEKEKKQFAEQIAAKSPDDFLQDKIVDVLGKKGSKGKGKGKGKYSYNIDEVADIVGDDGRDKATKVAAILPYLREKPKNEKPRSLGAKGGGKNGKNGKNTEGKGKGDKNDPASKGKGKAKGKGKGGKPKAGKAKDGGKSNKGKGNGKNDGKPKGKGKHRKKW